MKITITNIGYENFGGETDVLDVAFRIDGDEIYHAYLDADGDVDRDSLDVGGWDADEVVETLETMLKDKQDEIAKSYF